jgi:hypothetical protein
MKNAWLGRQPGQAEEKKLRSLSTPPTAPTATVTARRNAPRNAPPAPPDDWARRRFAVARHHMLAALAGWMCSDPAIVVVNLEISDTHDAMQRLTAISRELAR